MGVSPQDLPNLGVVDFYFFLNDNPFYFLHNLELFVVELDDFVHEVYEKIQRKHMHFFTENVYDLVLDLPGQLCLLLRGCFQVLQGFHYLHQFLDLNQMAVILYFLQCLL